MATQTLTVNIDEDLVKGMKADGYKICLGMEFNGEKCNIVWLDHQQ